MANWSTLKAAIANVIKTNGNQEITGALLQNTLNSIVSSVGKNATFAGIATPDTNPGAPDGPVFYLATTAGIYANFNGIEVTESEAVMLEWSDGAWSKKTSGLATQKKLAELESITKPLIRELWISNGIWLSKSNNHLIFPVLPNSNVEIKVKKAGYYTFLKSYKTPVIGETPSFATGYSDRVIFSYTTSVISPADAQYLYVMLEKSGNPDYEILSIKIDGFERYTTLDWVVTETTAKLGKIEPIVEDLNTNAIIENDLSYSSVTSNIANPENIINNKIVSSNGSIVNSTGWSIIKVDVQQGEILTFGGFYLGRSGYCAFYKDTEFLSVIQFSDPNGTSNPKTVEVPLNANLLYIDIQSTASPDNPYETLQINYGNVLKHYEEYSKVISHIKGIPLKGTNSEGCSTIVDIMVDLPVSDGSDIQVGFAYIDSQTKNIKVK